MFFVIYVWCAWCVQILLTFSQHLKLFRVDLKLSNEHHRSFLAQKLVLVAPIEFWWKFWKIDFRMKNSISDRKSHFFIRSWLELQKRVFVVKRRATRRWKALGPYFRFVSTLKYVHTSGTSYTHIKHMKNIWRNFENFKKMKFLILHVLDVCIGCAWCVHILESAHKSKV